jgi:hypothetical protein
MASLAYSMKILHFYITISHLLEMFPRIPPQVALGEILAAQASSPSVAAEGGRGAL